MKNFVLTIGLGLIFILVLVASPSKAGFDSSGGCALAKKYIPPTVVLTTMGRIVNRADGDESDCRYIFLDPQHPDDAYYETGIWTRIVEHESADYARFIFSIIPCEATRNDIGDGACVNGDGTSFAVKGKFVFEIDGISGSLSAAQAEALLRYAVSQVPEEPTEPKEEDTCSATNEPVVSSFAFTLLDDLDYEPIANSQSKGVWAGTEKFSPEFETINREQSRYQLVIQGKCLEGASLSNDAIVDPSSDIQDSRAIRQAVPDVSADGTSASGRVGVGYDTQAGPVTFTLTNKWLKTTTFPVIVKITGTQYLERTFANQGITFVGSWPTVNLEVRDLERQIKKAQDIYAHGEYEKLGITPFIYETGYWKSQGGEVRACPGNSFRVAGCASPQDNIIKLRADIDLEYPTLMETAGTIIHESAHKLHYYNLGTYLPLASSPSSFDPKWITLLKDVNPTTCAAIPLQGTSWKNTEDRLMPLCGFIRSYGASRFDEQPSYHYEDVATLTEEKHFPFGLLRDLSDARTGPFVQLYKDKLKLLDEYGF